MPRPRSRPVRPLLVAALLLLACVAVLRAAPASATTWGIADQKDSTFSQPAFAQLQAVGVRDARLVVPYDAVRYRRVGRYAGEFRRVDAWLRAAHAAGVDPLVTFTKTVRVGRAARRATPTPAAYVRELRRFRRTYPWVRNFSVWNEPNGGSVFARRPVALGRIYRAASRELRRACDGCRLLGGDLHGRAGVGRYARQVRRGAGRSIPTWGLNDYNDANDGTDRDVRSLLRSVGGVVWLTETGGVYARKAASERTNPFTAQRRHARTDAQRARWQLRATQQTFRIARRYASRVRRVYLYQLQSTPNADWVPGRRNGSWDSGLVDPRGRIRPALEYVLAQLG